MYVCVERLRLHSVSPNFHHFGGRLPGVLAHGAIKAANSVLVGAGDVRPMEGELHRCIHTYIIAATARVDKDQRPLMRRLAATI